MNESGRRGSLRRGSTAGGRRGSLGGRRGSNVGLARKDSAMTNEYNPIFMEEESDEIQ